MRTLFVGSGPFAVPALEVLAASPAGVELAGVISRPDRPARRGRRTLPTPVRARCRELGIECRTPPSVNDAAELERLRAASIDLSIVADYGEILRRGFLEIARIGAYNLHGSILPRHRGAAPVVHAILAGDGESGVTLFRIEPALDSGPVVAVRTTPIASDESAGELEARLANIAAEVLVESLPAFANGTFREVPQDAARATLAPKITKEMGRIDWSDSAAKIARRVRAFRPWPTAYTFFDRGAAGLERTAILRARAICPVAGVVQGVVPGVVADVSKDGFSIACGDGALEVLELQRQGGGAMSAGAYLRGRALRAGDRFVPEEERE